MDFEDNIDQVHSCKVLFPATHVQAVFLFLPLQTKHLHHNRRIRTLCRDVQTCTHPRTCRTSKLAVGPLLVTVSDRVVSGANVAPPWLQHVGP